MKIYIAFTLKDDFATWEFAYFNFYSITEEVVRLMLKNSLVSLFFTVSSCQVPCKWNCTERERIKWRGNQEFLTTWLTWYLHKRMSVTKMYILISFKYCVLKKLTFLLFTNTYIIKIKFNFKLKEKKNYILY